jgi:hypothetical protein
MPDHAEHHLLGSSAPISAASSSSMSSRIGISAAIRNAAIEMASASSCGSSRIAIGSTRPT